MQHEGITWKMRAKVLKYEPETMARLTEKYGHEPTPNELRALETLGLIKPDDIVDVIGNALVNVGKQRLGDLITGSGQAFTTTRGMTGVGNSTTAVGGSDTALLGASQLYKALDGAPTSVTGVITASTTFTGSEANFAWEEWCWAIATASPVTNASFATATTSGVMVNRKVQSLGTKVLNAVWTLQATATIA
jgi:hypothetical protein